MNSVFLSPVVCNAGPLIGLARVHLEWLPFQLFPEVIVLEEVSRELLVKDSADHEQLAVVLEKARISIRACFNQIPCSSQKWMRGKPP